MAIPAYAIGGCVEIALEAHSPVAFHQKIMRSTLSPLVGLTSVILALAASSCGVADSSRPAPRPNRVLHGWYDDGGPGKVSIRISLPDQIAEIERDGRPIGWCYVATGKEGHGTKAGTYRITEKIVDKYSNRYGWIEDEFGNVVDGDARPSDPVPEGAVYVPAPMPYWMRITSYGIGLHGGFIPEPGKPASHGCIRLPKEFVPTLFNEIEVGARVTITHERSTRAPLNASPEPQQTADRGRVIATRPLLPSDYPRLVPLRASSVRDFE